MKKDGNKGPTPGLADRLGDLRARAERGDADAQHAVGVCYLTGDGVELAHGTGFLWCLRAADQDHAEAQVVVSRCYREGLGVDRDAAMAMTWLRRAAEAGHPDAQKAIGVTPRPARSPAPAAAHGREDLAYRFVFLNAGWSGLGLGYDAEPALARLRAADRTTAWLSLGLDDIEYCDWDRQVFTLTAQASEALAKALPGDAGRHAGANALVALKRSLNWEHDFSHALDQRAFVVMLAERVVYGGIFLARESQMSIRYPVGRARLEGGRVALCVLPVHIPFAEMDPVAVGGGVPGQPFSTPDGAPLPPGFVSALAGLAESPLTQRMRALVRDPALREVLVAAGALVPQA